MHPARPYLPSLVRGLLPIADRERHPLNPTEPRGRDIPGIGSRARQPNHTTFPLPEPGAIPPRPLTALSVGCPPGPNLNPAHAVVRRTSPFGQERSRSERPPPQRPRVPPCGDTLTSRDTPPAHLDIAPYRPQTPIPPIFRPLSSGSACYSQFYLNGLQTDPTNPGR